MSTGTSDEELKKAFVQRPKVVFNSTTKKYVSIFKLYYNATGYDVCYTGVATADKATGPFTYASKYLAASATAGSGDFALFQNGKGDLYHIVVRKTDRVLAVAKMSSDYLSAATAYVPLPDVRANTEAPAIFFKDGVFHLLGSGSSGWDPNPARYYTSTSIDGPWTNRGNPCHGTNPNNDLGPEKTFGGQSTFIIEVQGADNQYIAMFDEWEKSNQIQTKHIWLPFRVNKNLISIDWIDRWNLDWFSNP